MPGRRKKQSKKNKTPRVVSDSPKPKRRGGGSLGGPPNRITSNAHFEEYKTEILRNAQHVVDLYVQLGEILDADNKGLGKGHNMDPDRLELLNTLKDDAQTAKKSIGELEEQLESRNPQLRSLGHIRRTFQTLKHNTKKLLSLFGRGIMIGAGKMAVEAAVPGLFTALGDALQRLADVISRLLF